MLQDPKLKIKQDKENIFHLHDFKAFNPQKSEWRLRNNKVDLDQAKRLFQSLDEASCQVIYADINYRKNLLDEICLPKMKDLKILDLGYNNIESVEHLRKAVMPNLTKIWLNNNRVINIESLEKCYFPKLNVVWLTDNKVTELKYQHVFWPELSEFYIQKNLLTTTVNIVKGEHPRLKWTGVQSNHWQDDAEELYIHPQKQQNRIRRKYSSIERVWMPIYFGQMTQRNNRQVEEV